MHGKVTIGLTCPITFLFFKLKLNKMFVNVKLSYIAPHKHTDYITVGSLPQLIGFIRFGEPVPHGLSARPRVWAGPTKG